MPRGYTRGRARVLRNSQGRGRGNYSRERGAFKARSERSISETRRGQGTKRGRGRGALRRGGGRGALRRGGGRGALKNGRGRGALKPDYQNSPFLRDPETFPDEYKLRATQKRGDLIQWIQRVKPYLIDYIPEILECIAKHKTHLTSTGFLAIMITHARKYRRRKTQARWLTDGVIMVLLPFVQNKLDGLENIIRSMVLHDFWWGNYGDRRGFGPCLIVDQIKIQCPYLRLFDEDQIFSSLQLLQKGKFETPSMNCAYGFEILEKDEEYRFKKFKSGYSFDLDSESMKIKEIKDVHAVVVQKFHRNWMPRDVIFDIKVVPLSYMFEEGLYDEMMKDLKQAVVDENLDEVLERMNEQDLSVRDNGYNLHFNHRFFFCERCEHLWMSNSYGAAQRCGHLECESSPVNEVLTLAMNELPPRQQRIFVNGGSHWSEHCSECMVDGGNCREKANEIKESLRLEELAKKKIFANTAAKKATKNTGQSGWMRSVWGKYRKVKVKNLDFAIVIAVNPEFGEIPPEKETSSKPKDDVYFQR